ncbi:hypothetical protein CRYUN_Cryun01aG0121800 [Craigia yunnanensis]
MVLVGSHDEKDGSNDESETVVDFRGNLVDKSKTGRWLAAGLILGAYDELQKLGVVLLTLATTIPSMRPPPCDDYRRQHHKCIEANGRQLALLYSSLYTTALGGGGIKSNVSGFSSDQFYVTDPKEKATIFFFNRFYFGISIGSLFAVIVLVYIQDNVGREWGYGISAGTMMIGVAVLLCGTPWYRCLDKAAILDDNCAANTNKNNPWVVSTVNQVEEVKMVLKLLPIWSTCILFWTIYSQMTTFTVEQATIMHRKVGSLVIPAGSFSAFLIITILLFTSLNEKVFVPPARKITHNVQGITSLQRIGIGLILSIVAMVGAAIVEKERREIAVKKEVKISAFWLLVQYFLVGAGEAFAYVGQLEFFIREAPDRMKSMSTGLFLSTISMGFFLSSLLVSIVDHVTKKSWLRSNLNKGKLNNFYWLLAVLGFLNFFVFLIFASRHQYKIQLPIKPESGEKELKRLNNEMIEDMEKKASIQ